MAASNTLIITSGGTYTGTWSSDDPHVPVILIKTTQPVILDHCKMSGPSALVESRIEHSNITLRDCIGTGMNPNIAGRATGRFLEDESFDRVRVERCELDHTAGIYLRDCIGNHDDDRSPTINVIANRALDIDGRRSDGHGGYLDFNVRTNLATNQTEAGFSEVQFLQLDGVHHVPRIDIAWNHVVNEPGLSRVEDNINIYNSSGTPKSPLNIHDNCIRGAYTIHPTEQTYNDADFTYDWSYSGGGIMLGDGAPKNPNDRCAYIQASDNVVIATTDYGIGISAGHDISFSRNTIVSSGVLADGRHIAAQNVGAYIWNLYKANRSVPLAFANNGGSSNLIGWINRDHRNDSWTPDAAFWKGNTPIRIPISRKLEDEAERAWQKRADSNPLVRGEIGPAQTGTRVEPVAAITESR